MCFSKGNLQGLGTVLDMQVQKRVFYEGGGVGKGRANSFLSCRYPPTFVRPKQEQWAAVLPLPSPHPFPDSRGPDHLGDVETLWGAPGAEDLQPWGLHFICWVTLGKPDVFGALEAPDFRKTKHIYYLRGGLVVWWCWWTFPKPPTSSGIDPLVA